MSIAAYPLHWPEGWARREAHQRQPSPYKVTFARARDDLERELRLAGARHVIISTNVPLRRDGLPLATFREPADPGVGVYWDDKQGIAQTIGCDVWRTVRENIRAVGLAIEYLRALERTGATEIVERAFGGFARLPAAPDCWAVLGLDGSMLRSAARDVVTKAINAAHRGLAMAHHPDRGGNPDMMARINAARDEALREIGA